MFEVDEIDIDSIKSTLWTISGYDQILWEDNGEIAGSGYAELILEMSSLAEVLLAEYDSLHYMYGHEMRDFMVSYMTINLAYSLIMNDYLFDPDILREKEADQETALGKINRATLREFSPLVLAYMERYYELVSAFLFLKEIMKALSKERSLS